MTNTLLLMPVSIACHKAGKLLFLLSIVMLSCTSEEKPLLQKIPITEGWTFLLSEEGPEAWYPASVPGTIHTDLLKNGLIPDPFYGCNEYELQWVGQKDWVYRKSFYADEQLLAKTHISLVFEGLDTYAKVFLNGSKLLEANNMFRKWEADCREFLQPGNNDLEIRFSSAEKRFMEDSLALGYPLPGGRWVFARKAAYHFGWDWSPVYITAGIHKPVYLETWDDHRPGDIQLYTTEITEKSARILTEMTFESDIIEQAVIRVSDRENGRIYAKQNIELNPERSVHSFEFQIQDPVLWWTNDLGAPHLYALQFDIETHSGFTHQQNIPYGIRTIEVITEDDQYGESLYLKLNGIPLFMKGANYIPQHSFVTEVSDEDYERVIENAVLSNMNMLRVWGGGMYERDIFYELCDQNGILVWQDFMFACAMYPGDDAFVENVRQEAIQQVKRLRNHACLAMWCGNNEVDEGWHNWQWQAAHNIQPADSATIWKGYQRVFHQLLPEVINTYDPGRFYLHTSPVHGWGHEESMMEGSAHYWGVWWGLEPFEMYLEKVPRFMSEFGFQAMPALATIRQFQTEEEDSLFSDALRCHQKHPTGYETITAYLERENLYPSSLREYIYLSQLIQAKGIGMAIEAHRRAQPRCMGTLYWQFNDCWPVTSWSGMDVNGNWKALQYTVRDLYDDIMVSVIDHNRSLDVYLVSGMLDDLQGRVELHLVDFENNRITLYEKDMLLPANSPVKVTSLASETIKSQYDMRRHLVEAVFTVKDRRSFKNQKFLEPYGNLNLPDSHLHYDIEAVQGGFRINIRATAFAAHVHLYLADRHAWFENNFFHLWPGEEKSVFCQSGLTAAEFEKQLQVYHMNAK